MPAATYDMILDQGSTFSNVIQITDSEETPLNLTGFTARMQVRPSVSSSTVLLELTNANSRITITAAEGKINLSVDAATTSGLTPGNYVYDLETVNGSVVERILQCSFLIRAEVTR